MITVTELAAGKIKEKLAQRQQGIGIRLGVRTTGCSGLAYVLEYVDQPRSADIVYHSLGVQLYVDPRSDVYLQNVTIDWQKQGLNEGFAFINPLEKARCGCGESFTV